MRQAAASASSATPVECSRSHGDLRPVSAAIARERASTRSPVDPELGETARLERLLPDPRLVEPVQ